MEIEKPLNNLVDRKSIFSVYYFLNQSNTFFKDFDLCLLHLMIKKLLFGNRF